MVIWDINTLRYKIHRVGQNHIYTPYMTVYMVVSLQEIPYTYRKYMVMANPKNTCKVRLGLLITTTPFVQYQYTV